MSDNRNLTPQDAQLAAEYALGLLDAAERSAAEARIARDPLLGREVARWRGRLASLLDDIAPADPPQSVWTAIARGLGDNAPPGGNVLLLKRRVQLWRGLTATATAIAASLALVLLFRPAEPAPVTRSPQPAAMVAALASDTGTVKLVATWDPASDRLIVAATGALRAPPGRAHEIWLIPAGGKPLALGLLSPSARWHTQLPPALSARMRSGATIAVSIEPAGGSATGLPTGPVIAAGALETS